MAQEVQRPKKPVKKAAKNGFFRDMARSYFLGPVRVAGSSNNMSAADCKMMCADCLRTFWVDIYSSIFPFTMGAIGKNTLAASVPAIIVSFFTREEIERDRKGFAEKLSAILPEQYRGLFHDAYSGNALLFLGGYRPGSGADDISFWFGRDEKGEDMPKESPFSVYVGASRCGEREGETVISLSGRDGMEKVSFPHPGEIQPECEAALWDALLRCVSALPEKWVPIAKHIAGAYGSALQERNSSYGPMTLPPGKCFTPPEFLALELEKGKTVLETISEKGTAVFDTSGDTLSAEYPGTEMTVFEKWLDVKRKVWESGKDDEKKSFGDISILNYTYDGKKIEDSIYMECVNAHSNKFYRMKNNHDGTFTAQWGPIGKTAQTKTYSMSEWEKKLMEKYRKGYVTGHDGNVSLAPGLESPGAFHLAKAVSIGAAALYFSEKYILSGKILHTMDDILGETSRAVISSPHPGASMLTNIFPDYAYNRGRNDERRPDRKAFPEKNFMKTFLDLLHTAGENLLKYLPEIMKTPGFSLCAHLKTIHDGCVLQDGTCLWDKSSPEVSAMENMINMLIGAASSSMEIDGEQFPYIDF